MDSNKTNNRVFSFEVDPPKNGITRHRVPVLIKKLSEKSYTFYSIRKRIELAININGIASALTNPGGVQMLVHHNNIWLTSTLYLAIAITSRTSFSYDFFVASQTEHNRISLALFMCVSCRGRSGNVTSILNACYLGHLLFPLIAFFRFSPLPFFPALVPWCIAVLKIICRQRGPGTAVIMRTIIGIVRAPKRLCRPIFFSTSVWTFCDNVFNVLSIKLRTTLFVVKVLKIIRKLA